MRLAGIGSVPPAVAGGSALRITTALTSCNDLAKISLPHPHMWNDNDHPIAYFISFRTYGTWLHGDLRGSIDRLHNQYGSPYLPPNKKWRNYNQELMQGEPLILGRRQRASVETAIRETCRIRRWALLAVNVRTNHAHTVITANRKAELVLNALKANATRQLRAEGLWPPTFSPWADKGSTRLLWNERSVASAVDYILNGQGGDPPDFDD